MLPDRSRTRAPQASGLPCSNGIVPGDGNPTHNMCWGNDDDFFLVCLMDHSEIVNLLRIIMVTQRFMLVCITYSMSCMTRGMVIHDDCVRSVS